MGSNFKQVYLKQGWTEGRLGNTAPSVPARQTVLLRPAKHKAWKASQKKTLAVPCRWSAWKVELKSQLPTATLVPERPRWGCVEPQKMSRNCFLLLLHTSTKMVFFRPLFHRKETSKCCCHIFNEHHISRRRREFLLLRYIEKMMKAARSDSYEFPIPVFHFKTLLY